MSSHLSPRCPERQARDVEMGHRHGQWTLISATARAEASLGAAFMGSENVLHVSPPRSSDTPQRQVLSLRPLRPQTPLTSSEQESSREGESCAPEVEKPQIPRCHSSAALRGPCLPSAEPALTRGAMSPGLKGKRWAVRAALS